MKRKKPVNNSKNSTKNEPWYKRLIKIQYIVAVVLIIFLLLVGNYIYEQLKLRNSIAEAGTNLDTLKSQIDKTSISGETSRSKYCYHAGRKYASEPIYCMQKLVIEASNISDEDILSDFSTLTTTINNDSNFNYVNESVIKEFNQNNVIYGYFINNLQSNYVNCRIEYTAYGNSYRITEMRGSYEVSMKCLAGDFSNFIYPKLKN